MRTITMNGICHEICEREIRIPTGTLSSINSNNRRHKPQTPMYRQSLRVKASETSNNSNTMLWSSCSWSTKLSNIITFGLILAAILSIPYVNGLANCPNGCQCDDDTLVVKCGEGTLDVLPIALNPSIQRLIIKNNKIKTIDSSIQFYAELTFLDLSYNDLVTIPARTFSYQRKLQELHLNHNKIGQISEKTFMGLSSITVLNLRGNLIAELTHGTFSSMTKIEELNLGQNRISHIDPNVFDGMINLRVLYLDDNTLTTVPTMETFQAVPSLAELYLGTNSFMTIPGGAFQDLKGLIRLDLRGAGLQQLAADALKGLEGVRYLDLSDNRLEKIPTEALSGLERLEELSLGQNDFDAVRVGAFAGLKNLRRLVITGAQRLKIVENGAFGTNTNLEFLNLSSNKMLSLIQENALSSLPHLRHVILKENHLSTLEEGLVPWDNLQTLDLSDNPIVCDCRVLWLRNLLLSKNSTTDQFSNVMCASPDHLAGIPLYQVSVPTLGCSHADSKKQAMISIVLVVTAALITVLFLVLYSCRRRIRDLLKGGWGNSALRGKEQEYQKTFSDEEYMTRQQHPCNLGVHPSAPYPGGNYTPHHGQYLASRTIPVTEL